MEFKDFLIEKGIKLSEIGINEIALNKNDSLIAIDLLRMEKIPIFGGDVYEIKHNIILSTYDSWYFECKNLSSKDEQVDESCNKAKDYISNYNEKGNKIFYTLVIPK